MEEDRIRDDPKYHAGAMAITAEFGEAGEPMAWRIQEDGTLTVILPSGKKINRPLPAGPSETARPRAGAATNDDAEARTTPRRRTDPKPIAQHPVRKGKR